MNDIKERIKAHEGYRLEPYHCTEGHLTGGWGHKILDGEEVPKSEEASKKFEVMNSTKEYDSFPIGTIYRVGKEQFREKKETKKGTFAEDPILTPEELKKLGIK